MANETKITFAKVGWSEVVFDHMTLIKGIANSQIEAYQEAVKIGSIGLLGVFIGSDRIGSILWNISDEKEGCFFQILEMGAGHNKGFDLTKSTLAMAKVFAPRLGATNFRFSTSRRGLFEKIKNDCSKLIYTLEGEL